MDDFGDIIYIVFMILAALAGVARSSKKKKEEQQRRAAYQRQRDAQKTSGEEVPNKETYIETIFDKLEKAITGEEDERETIIEEIGTEYEPRNEQQKETFTEKAEENPFQHINETLAREQFLDKSDYISKLRQTKRHSEPYEEMKLVDLDNEGQQCFNIHDYLNTPKDLKKAVILSEIIQRKF